MKRGYDLVEKAFASTCKRVKSFLGDQLQIDAPGDIAAVQGAEEGGSGDNTNRINVLELSDTFILDVFSKLSFEDLVIASEVCEQWNSIARYISLWSPSFTTKGDEYNTRTVRGVIRLNPLLTHLIIEDRQDCNKILYEIYQSGRKLKSLVLVNCKASDGGQNYPRKIVGLLKSACPELINLSVETDLGKTNQLAEDYECFVKPLPGRGVRQNHLNVDVRLFSYVAQGILRYTWRATYSCTV